MSLLRRKAITHGYSVGTLKRCPQCGRKYEVRSGCLMSRPIKRVMGCIGLGAVLVVGLVCAGMIGNMGKAPSSANQPAPAKPDDRTTPPVPARPPTGGPPPLPAGDPPQPPAGPPQLPAGDPAQANTQPTPKDEADAVESVLAAHDLLVRGNKDAGRAKLQGLLRAWPGTRAAAEREIGWPKWTGSSLPGWRTRPAASKSPARNRTWTAWCKSRRR